MQVRRKGASLVVRKLVGRVGEKLGDLAGGRQEPQPLTTAGPAWSAPVSGPNCS